MVGYAGRHSCKQYMKSKPIKWGYKLWVISGSNGYPYHVEMYQGRRMTPSSKPLGYEIVMKMVDIMERENCNLPSYALYMDNFFTGYQLLVDLRKKGLRASGVLRKDRLGPKNHKPILKQEKCLKNRGDLDSKSDGLVLVVRMKDSSIVNMGTNFDSIKPKSNVTRRSKKGNVIYAQPKCFKNYNANMGGVDLTNRFVVDYSPSITGKKWYWPLILNAISLMRVAAWRIMTEVYHGRTPMDQLTFLRAVVKGMASENRFDSPTIAQPSAKHVQISRGGQGRCKVCNKNSRMKCDRCNVWLHTHCAPDFNHIL